MQLVEVQLPEIVDVPAVDGEQQSRRPHAGAIAVRASALDHDLVEPCLHARVRLASLAITPVVPLDAPCNAVKTNLAAFLVVAPHPGIRRRGNWNFAAADSVENRLSRLVRPSLPWTNERKVQRGLQAVHNPAIPCVRVALERLAHEASSENVALGIGNQQVR